MFVVTDDLIDSLDVAAAWLSAIANDWGTQEAGGSDEAARNAGRKYRTLYEHRRDTLRSLANELRDNVGKTYSPADTAFVRHVELSERVAVLEERLGDLIGKTHTWYTMRESPPEIPHKDKSA